MSAEPYLALQVAISRPASKGKSSDFARNQATHNLKSASLIDRKANQTFGRVEDCPETTATPNEITSERESLCRRPGLITRRDLVFHTLPLIMSGCNLIQWIMGVNGYW